MQNHQHFNFCPTCQAATPSAPDTCDQPGRMFCEVCGTYNPDPNLDDEDLIQACFECSEAIARGDSCTMCEASWHEQLLVHNQHCLFLIVSDMLSTERMIEDALDGAT